MRVIAYNIREEEKALLTKANAKVHDLTFISNPLTEDTVQYVTGKEVILISERDLLQKPMLQRLFDLGVRSVITRSLSTSHIDLDAAGALNMHVANTPFADQSPEGLAKQTMDNLNHWMIGGCAGQACQCRMDCTNKSVSESQEGGQL